jgi:glycosyltransferase involved in cell wall biosynthesis
MKKILYLSYDGMTDSLGESQVLSYLKEISKSHTVNLVSFEKKENFNKVSRIKQITKDHNINWKFFYYTKKPPVISTLFDLFKMYFFVKKNIDLSKNTLIHSRSYFASLVALIIKNKFHVPFIFDMRGWMIDENLERKSWTGFFYKPVVKVLRKLEIKYISQSDVIISLTQRSKEILINKYGTKPSKINVIPTCVERENFYFDEKSRLKIRNNYNIKEDDFLLIYTGSIGGYYNINEMLSFFKELLKHKPSSKFLFLTQQSENIVYESAFVNGIDESLIIVEKTTLDKVFEYLSAADAGLVLYDASFSSTGRSPTKLAEYWSCGLRAFAPRDLGDLNLYFNDIELGSQFKNFDNTSYKNCIKDFFNNSFTRSEVSSKLDVNFNHKMGSINYLKVYEKFNK